MSDLDSPAAGRPPADRLIEAVATWARRREDVRGVALVGSHARGEARIDSDIDFVLLVPDPDLFRTGDAWLDAIAWDGLGLRVDRWQDEDYGVAWSRRLWLHPHAEIEFTFVRPSWAALTPIDSGTRRVISDGCRILHDRDHALSRLCLAVERSAKGSDPRMNQLATLAQQWRLTLEDTPRLSQSGLVCFARREDESAVLKVPRSDSDEAMAAVVLEQYQGRGAVRLLARSPEGGMLIERATPGQPLTELVLAGDDDQATEIVCDVAAALHDAEPGSGPFPRVEEWAQGFEQYIATADQTIPAAMVDHARRLFDDLAASQGPRRLLHGDLHHDNILFDARRGWLAIDPKGVFGEASYELGAALRNPTQDPSRFATQSIVDRRVSIFSDRLSLDRKRVLSWAFAQAVLSAIWSIEDGLNPVRGLATAAAIAPMLST